MIREWFSRWTERRHQKRIDRLQQEVDLHGNEKIPGTCDKCGEGDLWRGKIFFNPGYEVYNTYPCLSCGSVWLVPIKPRSKHKETCGSPRPDGTYYHHKGYGRRTNDTG